MHSLTQSSLSLLFLQLLAIIGLSRLIGRLTRWLGQPLVIAEVAAGILLGPSLLGWVAPEGMQALFPASSLPALHMLSQVGLVLFMFLVGLELDARRLKGRGHVSVVIGHTSLIVPFALGAAAALWLYPRLAEPAVPLTSFILFMGVAMSITAFPVLARILTEQRLLQSRVGAIAITCAAAGDVTVWCLLAFVVSIIRTAGIAQAAWMTLWAVLYVAVMLLAVRPFLKRLGARVANKEGLSPNAVAVTLLLLLASSWVTEFIGIHSLFGAFLLGAILPKEGGLAAALAEKIEDVALVLLLPVFFAYSGLRTQVGLLDTPGDWAMCGLILLVACVGKLGGSAVAARVMGLRWREAGAVGVLMNTRGLMVLVVLNIGLDLGLLSPTLFTMLVMVALVTTVLTSPLLRWIYPPAELAKEEVKPAPLPPGAAPFAVLMCVADARTGPGLVTVGRALTGSGQEASRLYALHLHEPSERASFHLRHAQEPASEGALAPLLWRASSLGVQVEPLSFVSAEPALDICRTAEARRADLILLGWHKPLLGQAVLGGTVHDVMHDAPTQVAVFVDRGLEKLQRVLVPFIGSQRDRGALQLAQRLVHHAGVEVTVLHVVAPERAHGGAGAQVLVEEMFRESSGRVRFKAVVHESPEDAVLEEAGAGYELIVVGVGPEWGLKERLFGLYRERLVRDAPTSLLVVRQPASLAAEAPAVPVPAGALPVDGRQLA
ncbi:MAG: cation:proton antiporter [Myxococcaceae bacterium]|nr:cation:proton antiporter [Myxococcaceae bacterium]